MAILILSNTLIFILIAALHIYWVLGGRWGFGSVLPQNREGKVLQDPGPLLTLFVALGLLGFAAITSGNLGLWDAIISRRFIHIGNWIIAVIFTARAMGDFRYIGFTKKVKDTKFAVNDSRIYSPLCLIIGMTSLVIGILSMDEA